MAGIKLRDAPRRRVAAPRPLARRESDADAFAETYTGLQTGAIDGQDNPLPNVQAVSSTK